ncbi:hypothetical protein C8R47DRAFT_1121723 [Mycena vitilis]|nr:hypothetical protein C8R47DRAFT_1121723 [Mycena vitilis]
MIFLCLRLKLNRCSNAVCFGTILLRELVQLDRRSQNPLDTVLQDGCTVNRDVARLQEECSYEELDPSSEDIIEIINTMNDGTVGAVFVENSDAHRRGLVQIQASKLRKYFMRSDSLLLRCMYLTRAPKRRLRRGRASLSRCRRSSTQAHTGVLRTSSPRARAHLCAVQRAGSHARAVRPPSSSTSGERLPSAHTASPTSCTSPRRIRARERLRSAYPATSPRALLAPARPVAVRLTSSRTDLGLLRPSAPTPRGRATTTTRPRLVYVRAPALTLRTNRTRLDLRTAQIRLGRGAG